MFPGFRPKSAGDFFIRIDEREALEENLANATPAPWMIRTKLLKNLLNGSGVDGFLLCFRKILLSFFFYLPSFRAIRLNCLADLQL